MKSPSLLATLTLLLASGIGLAAEHAIHFRPEAPLLDDVIRIHVNGLPPGKEATLQASTILRGQVWRSWAVYVANERGEVNVAEQAPIRGTYASADPMGLFWSMEPTDAALPEELPPAIEVTDPRTTRLEALVNGTVVARRDCQRWLARPGVRVSEVKAKGLVGRLYLPEEAGRHPAVLVLSGSEGGIKDGEAALLASRGYAAFALAYFNAGDLPKQLVKIPLEYLRTGLDWLKAHEAVDPARIGVMGGSKGGELALLLAATYPDVKAVVASVPSHVVWSGIGGTYQESSWTLGGKALPCVPARPTPTFFAKMQGKEPVPLLELYDAGLKDEARERQALIPVEMINGAVLVISGTDDQMWPSARMADKVVARLKEYNHPRPYEHLRYEGAGHGIPPAYVPLKNAIVSGRFALGGTVEANALALADSRPKVLQFLETNLRN